MTARDILTRECRRYLVAVWGGMAFILIGTAAFKLTGQPEWFILWVPGVALALGATIVAQLFGLRCPYCRGSLFQLVFHRGGWTFSRKVAFCPYCGVALDDELDDVTPAEDTNGPTPRT